jgi:hypothetical protein
MHLCPYALMPCALPINCKYRARPLPLYPHFRNHLSQMHLRPKDMFASNLPNPHCSANSTESMLSIPFSVSPQLYVGGHIPKPKAPKFILGVYFSPNRENIEHLAPKPRLGGSCFLNSKECLACPRLLLTCLSVEGQNAFGELT